MPVSATPAWKPGQGPVQLAAGVLTCAGASGPLSFTPAGGGGFAGAEISASPTAGANNDFDPGGSPAWPGGATTPYGILILTDGGTPGVCNLTGLLAGLSRQQVLIINNRTNTATLNDRNAGSTAANQFFIGDGTGAFDLTLSVGNSVLATYSSTLSRWVITP